MLRRQINRHAMMACLVLLAVFAVRPVLAQVPWPVEPTNADQPYGNVFGEFQQYGGNVYLHPGHDIRVDPAPKGPWVRSVREGLLRLYDNAGDPTSRYNGITIAAPICTGGTITARYWHLDHNSIQLSVRWAHALRRFNIRLRANVRMSQVVD